jgi:hypothetical protein
MNFASAKSLSLGWAIAGAPIAYGPFVYFSYRVALANGHVPFGYLSFWPWLGIIVAIATGAVALLFSHRRSPLFGLDQPILIVMLYALLMLVPLAVMHTVAACASGDCF